jgi:hypothetical protein
VRVPREKARGAVATLTVALVARSVQIVSAQESDSPLTTELRRLLEGIFAHASKGREIQDIEAWPPPGCLSAIESEYDTG